MLKSFSQVRRTWYDQIAQACPSTHTCFFHYFKQKATILIDAVCCEGSCLEFRAECSLRNKHVRWMHGTPTLSFSTFVMKSIIQARVISGDYTAIPAHVLTCRLTFMLSNSYMLAYAFCLTPCFYSISSMSAARVFKESSWCEGKWC